MAGEMVGRPVVLPELPQLAGAIGASLYALDEADPVGIRNDIPAGETNG
jgi:activator of 2-hydroxyglutaryl-CoA dehydratase